MTHFNHQNDTATIGEEPPAKRIKVEEQTASTSLLTSSKVVAVNKRGRRSGKTSDQRAMELLGDMRVSAVEPHQVLCKMCGNWIRLFKHTEYAAANWRVHAERCAIRTNWNPRVKSEERPMTIPSPATPTAVILTAPPPGIDDGITILDGPPPATSISSISSWRRRGKTDEERQKLLQDDEHLLEVEAHRVLCGLCNGWVKLHNTRTFDAWNWSRHKEKCIKSKDRLVPNVKNAGPQQQPTVHSERRSLRVSGAGVGSMVVPTAPNSDPVPEPEHHVPKRRARTAQERLKAFQNDPRCGDIRPSEAFCLMCNKWIALSKDVPYIDSNWNRHADRCFIRNGKAWKSSKEKAAEGEAPAEDVKLEPLSVVLNMNPDPQPDTSTEILSVLCAACKQWVVVQVGGNNSTRDIWGDHRKHCKTATQLEKPPVPVAETVAAPTLDVPMSNGTGQPEPPPAADPDQRRLQLLNDPRCADVDVHEVLCKMCNRLVVLDDEKEYHVANWLKHAKRCEVKNSSFSSVSTAVAGPSQVSQGDSVSAALIGAPQISQAVSSDQLSASEDVEEILQSSSQVANESTADMARDRRLATFEPGGFYCKICATSTHFSTIVPRMDEIAWNSHVTGDAHLKNCAFVQIKFESTAEVNPRVKASRSTAGDRKKLLENDPRVGQVEPHRIFCNVCQRWLKLNKVIEYATYNWQKHSQACEGKSGPKPGPSGASPDVKLEESEPVSARVRMRSTIEQRKAKLDGDPRITVVEAHRVLCQMCGKWLKLQSRIEFDCHNWDSHAIKCEAKSGRAANGAQSAMDVAETSPAQQAEAVGASPPTPATAEPSGVDRNLGASPEAYEFLQGDPRCGSVDPFRALCLKCNEFVLLRGDVQVNMAAWAQHIQQCDNAAPLSKLAEKRRLLARKADEDRLASLKADKRIAAIEPGRVYCKMCQSWIRLNSPNSYLTGNWVRHAERCQLRNNSLGGGPAPAAVPIVVITPPPPINSLKRKSNEVLDLTDDIDEGDGVFGSVELGDLVELQQPSYSSTTFAVQPAESSLSKPPSTAVTSPHGPKVTISHSVPVHDSSGSPSKRLHRTEEARRNELKADNRIHTIEEYRVLCRLCQKWIQLRRDVTFSGQNWQKHIGLCSVRAGAPTATKSRSPAENANQEDLVLPTTQVVSATTTVNQSEAPEIIPYSLKRLRDHLNNRFSFSIPTLSMDEDTPTLSTNGGPNSKSECSLIPAQWACSDESDVDETDSLALQAVLAASRSGTGTPFDELDMDMESSEDAKNNNAYNVVVVRFKPTAGLKGISTQPQPRRSSVTMESFVAEAQPPAVDV